MMAKLKLRSFDDSRSQFRTPLIANFIAWMERVTRPSDEDTGKSV
jgi:hypothetical protein